MSRLYVVGTPIGNLNDFSPRALQTLRDVDFIAAEDTRVTLKLLNRFNIKTPMVSYHEHNRQMRGAEILTRLQNGETCALVTDAGMPAISDPGEDLVRLVRENGIAVESVPGPTAFATAMAVSGMPSGRFTFEGFLSMNKRVRTAHLDALRTETRTMIFYEAPHKLPATLKDMLAVFGDREIALCRELTKLHEQVVRTTLSAAVAYTAEHRPVGEYVVIVQGLKELPPEHAYTLEDAVKIAKEYMQNGMSAAAAAKEAAAQTGLKKGEIYKQVVETK